jgi:hypothetical protein
MMPNSAGATDKFFTCSERNAFEEALASASQEKKSDLVAILFAHELFG